MIGGVFRGLDPRRYDRNVRRYILFSIFYFSGFGLFFLLYNLYLLRLGYREDFIGQIASMGPLASGLFAIPIGFWSDRIGRGPFLLAAAILLFLAQLVLCLSTSSALLLVFAFLAGISTSLVFVNHVPFLAENSSPGDRGRVFAVGYSTQVLTRMVISVVGGSLPALMASFFGMTTDRPDPFRYVLLLGAGLTMLAAVPLVRIQHRRSRLPKPTPPPVTPEERSEVRKVLGLLTVNNAFKGLAGGICFPFFNVFFQEELLASVAAIGVIFFCGQATALSSTMAVPAISRRYGKIRSLILIRFLAALALAWLGGVESLVLGAILYTIFTSFENANVPVEMALATDFVDRRYWGRVQSLKVTSYQLLSAAGSFWAGRTILGAGYALTFRVGALCLLGSVIVILLGFGGSARKDLLEEEERRASVHPNASRGPVGGDAG